MVLLTDYQKRHYSKVVKRTDSGTSVLGYELQLYQFSVMPQFSHLQNGGGGCNNNIYFTGLMWGLNDYIYIVI